jgi:cyclin-dependent kinase regulatory subunit CKS1
MSYHRCPDQIEYSDVVIDTNYEYQQIYLSKRMAKRIPKNTLLSEAEWTAMGVITQSAGWEHFDIYKPEPWVLLLRKPLDSGEYQV